MLTIFDQAKREIIQSIERSTITKPVYYTVSVGHGTSYIGIRKSLASPIEMHSIEYPMDYDETIPRLLNSDKGFVCLNSVREY
jgi:hypothetical protein